VRRSLRGGTKAILVRCVHDVEENPLGVGVNHYAWAATNRDMPTGGIDAFNEGAIVTNLLADPAG